ncbi:MAG: hypothetical protein ACOCP4_05155, partial [Candidatus Woesearchaeota archaeon]
GDEYKATSVLFEYGPYAYAMFKKYTGSQVLDVKKLKSKINHDENFPESAVEEVKPGAKKSDTEECICEAWLAQLLLNSLASSRSKFEKYHFCNLTGSLILVTDFNKSKKFISAAKITIDREYLLNVNMETYRSLSSISNGKNPNSKNKKNSLKGPQYVLNKSTYTLRRKLESDENLNLNNIYLKKGFEGKKVNYPFLNFKSSKDYKQSRAGILHYILDNIEKYLSEYMSVTLSSLNPDHCIELQKTILKHPKHIKSMLNDKKINIVDKVQNEQYSNFIEMLCNELSTYIDYENSIIMGNKDVPGLLNIRIIHNSLFYVEKNETDEYLSSTSEVSRQNITIENVDNFPEAAIKTIIKELLIKQDINDGKLTLFDWSMLNTDEKWTFVTSDKKMNYIVLMNILPDGHFTFEFEGINENYYLENGKYQDYYNLLSKYNPYTKKMEKNNYLEGLIISENGDKNLISLTDEITIPDLISIKSIIDEVDEELPRDLRTGYQLASVVDNFFEKHGFMNGLINQLKELGTNELSKGQFKRLLNNELHPNNKLSRQFRDYLYKHYKVRLNFPKNKESLYNLFDSSLNIKYIENGDDEAYYFVGYRRENVKDKFKGACHLRKISAVNGSDIILKDLLPTMDVDFVQTGQSTVIPFPFKYLREYERIKIIEMEKT